MRTTTRIASFVGATALAGGLLVAGGTAYASGSAPAPAASASGTTTTCHGRARDLTPEQCAAFTAQRQALRAERDAILTKYGITPPTKGHRIDRSQVQALSRIQKVQLRSELLGWRAKLLALYSDFGIELPSRPHRG
ncbi:MAG TPA: hypothetical protein VFL59_05405 [Candidatus Nanopelagicales bacterium]|nr:hypothetical protein [Candidatus Nanopelagicales bacterium]